MTTTAKQDMPASDRPQFTLIKGEGQQDIRDEDRTSEIRSRRNHPAARK